VFRETEIDRVPDANKAGLGPGAASQLTHHMLQKFQVEQQSLVRFHMAKEFSALPACWRTCATRSATRLQELQPVGPLAVREAIDPQRTFLNLYLTQLFQDEQPDTYTPPNNLPMRPQGIMDESEDWLTLREQLQPHLPLRAINEVHSPVLAADIRIDNVDDEPAAAAASVAPAAAAADAADAADAVVAVVEEASEVHFHDSEPVVLPAAAAPAAGADAAVHHPLGIAVEPLVIGPVA